MSLTARCTFVCLSAVLWAGTAHPQAVPLSSLIVDSPNGIHASGLPGGPIYPSTFQYRIRSSAGPIKYSINTPSWLSANPAVGTTDASGVTITLTINKEAARLRPGNYGPAVAFANVTNGRGTTIRTSVLVIRTPTSAPAVSATRPSPPHAPARPASAPPASAESRADCLRFAGERLRSDLAACHSPLVECLKDAGVRKNEATCTGSTLVAGLLILVDPTKTSGVVVPTVTSALLSCTHEAYDAAEKCSPTWGTCQEAPFKAFKEAIAACQSR